METRIIVNHPSGFEHDPVLPVDLCESLADIANAMIADGFANYPGGIWGQQDRERGTDPKTKQLYHTGVRLPKDNSLKLLKDDTTVYIVCRDIGARHDHNVMVWLDRNHYVPDEVVNEFVRQGYNRESFEAMRNICNYCQTSYPADQLKSISFAQRVCRTCDTPALRAKVEFPGWYN